MRMTNGQLKRILRAHPELLDALFVMPAEQAHAIAASPKMPTFAELVDMTKAKYPEYADDEWAVFDRVIDGKRRHAAAKVQRKRVFGLVMASIAVLAVLFFTLIPTGRAWAKAAYEYVARMAGQVLFIQSTAYDGPPLVIDDTPADTESVLDGEGAGMDEAEFEEISFASLDAFMDDTDRRPLLLPADVGTPVSVRYIVDPLSSRMLITTYQTDDGNTIILRQEWDLQTDQATVFSGEIQQATILDDTLLYYSIDPADGSFSGYAVLDDSVVSIGFSGHLDAAVILSALAQADR